MLDINEMLLYNIWAIYELSVKNSTHLFLPDVKTDCENCSQGVGKVEMEIDVSR